MQAPRLRPEPIWTRTPPALGPVCLGLLGVGLVWRAATGVLGAPEAVGGVWIGASLAVFALCLGLYLRKIVQRPGALSYDLRMPAGRGAVPAFTMGLMLAGAAVEPFAPVPGAACWMAGVVGHIYLATLLARELFTLPPEGRPATPTLYVPFVGAIVAPIGGVDLGFYWVSAALFWLSVAAWAALTPAILRRLARAAGGPPPTRPGTWILLAPPAIGLVSYDALAPGGPFALAMFALACAALFGLASRARWLTEGGWTPAWGAFTFPSAAFAGACLVMARWTDSPVLDAVAAAAVTGASLITLYVALRTAQAAMKGKLFGP